MKIRRSWRLNELRMFQKCFTYACFLESFFKNTSSVSRKKSVENSKHIFLEKFYKLENLVLTVSLLVASWKLPLGYRNISTLSDFLIMMLFINAAENLRKISTRIHFSVKSEIHQMMILTKRVLGQRDLKHE